MDLPSHPRSLDALAVLAARLALVPASQSRVRSPHSTSSPLQEAPLAGLHRHCASYQAQQRNSYGARSHSRASIAEAEYVSTVQHSRVEHPAGSLKCITAALGTNHALRPPAQTRWQAEGQPSQHSSLPPRPQTQHESSCESCSGLSSSAPCSCSPLASSLPESLSSVSSRSGLIQQRTWLMKAK